MKHILLQQMEGNVLCSSAVQIMVGSFEESYWNEPRSTVEGGLIKKVCDAGKVGGEYFFWEKKM